jgi:hypothetical protein
MTLKIQNKADIWAFFCTKSRFIRLLYIQKDSNKSQITNSSNKQTHSLTGSNILKKQNKFSNVKLPIVHTGGCVDFLFGVLKLHLTISKPLKNQN